MKKSERRHFSSVRIPYQKATMLVKPYLKWGKTLEGAYQRDYVRDVSGK